MSHALGNLTKLLSFGCALQATQEVRRILQSISATSSANHYQDNYNNLNIGLDEFY